VDWNLILSKIYPRINFNLSLKRLEILSDKKGLSKVIDNLVDNGVKYSTNSKNIDINMKEKNLFIQDYGVGMVKRFCDKNI
jgi:signal transduction histidine kinase